MFDCETLDCNNNNYCMCTKCRCCTVCANLCLCEKATIDDPNKKVADILNLGDDLYR